MPPSSLRPVYVIGVGMTKFEKPGVEDELDYPDLVYEAATKALTDAKIDYQQIEQAIVGFCFSESCSGQKALYKLGMTGIPIHNVNNNCSTGSSALMLGKHIIEGGIADCVMAVGFEKMKPGPLVPKFSDNSKNPVDRHIERMAEFFDIEDSPILAQLFGNAGLEHMNKYGTKPEHFAKIAWKNHKHSVNNPYSQFQQEYSLEEIMKSPNVHKYLTRLQCCPTSNGAACAILASESFVKKYGLERVAVKILAQTMSTDLPSTFQKDCKSIIGFDITKRAAEEAYRLAGIEVNDVQVIELHDCFSANELLTYEALGLCSEGKAGEFIDRGDNTYGGKFVINPSGGLISKGHPLGATGLAQCAELCWQLRGLAGERQVKEAKIGLQHNLGLGGAVVVTIYERSFQNVDVVESLQSIKPIETDKILKPKENGGNGNSETNSEKPDKIIPLTNVSPSSSSSSTTTLSVKESDFKVKPLFDEIAENLKKNGEEFVKKINGIFCFRVKNKNKNGLDGVWIIDAKNQKGRVTFDPKGKGDVTLTIQDEDLYNMLLGQLNPQKAYFQGKLKISGNMGLAMKLQQLKPQQLKSKL